MVNILGLIFQNFQKFSKKFKFFLGKWKVIVNLPDEYYAKGHSKGMQKYSQTQRLEQCM